ncbi:MAG: hypothetical protein ACYT04_14355 [Nostoc sp.]
MSKAHSGEWGVGDERDKGDKRNNPCPILLFLGCANDFSTRRYANATSTQLLETLRQAQGIALRERQVLP